MNTQTTDAPDSRLATIVALILLIPAVYVAFWQLDGWIIPMRLAFVVIAPSVIASTVAAIVGALSHPKAPQSKVPTV